MQSESSNQLQSSKPDEVLVQAFPGSDIYVVLSAERAAALERLSAQFDSNTLDPPTCWTRGGLTVTTLEREFNDPGWAARGQYRSMIQFVMNWNNWPSTFDRYAMLDGEPSQSMPNDQRARIAAVVHCLCARDGFLIPDWVQGVVAQQRGGVSLTREARLCNRWGFLTKEIRLLKRRTPRLARKHKVWFEPDLLNRK